MLLTWIRSHLYLLKIFHHINIAQAPIFSEYVSMLIYIKNIKISVAGDAYRPCVTALEELLSGNI